MIKNNERSHLIVLPYHVNKEFFIMIYDLVKKKEENFIYLGDSDAIYKIQHYYNPSKKNSYITRLLY